MRAAFKLPTSMIIIIILFIVIFIALIFLITQGQAGLLNIWNFFTNASSNASATWPL